MHSGPYLFRRPGPARRSTRFFHAVTATSGALLVALTVILLSSCRSQPDSLRIGILDWPPYDLAHFAASEGLIDPATDLVNFQTPSEVVRSFRYGLIDAMFVTSQFALTMLREIEDVRIIYVIDVSLGGDALLVKPGFESADALTGARIGVESAPLGIYTLVRALGELEIARDDVRIVNVDTPEQLQAWQSDSIDALVTYEPTRSLVRREGGIELFSSQSIPYEIVDVLVVRQPVLDRHRDELVRFVDGLDQAVNAFRQDKERIAEQLAARHPITPTEFREAMGSVELLDVEDNLDILTDRSHPVVEALAQQCRVMVDAGMLVTEPDLDPLLEASVVQEVAGQ